MRSQLFRRFFVGVAVIVAVNQTWVADCRAADDETNQVLEWNQILIDTLIQSNAVNAASPRLSAIVHTALVGLCPARARSSGCAASSSRPRPACGSP